RSSEGPACGGDRCGSQSATDGDVRIEHVQGRVHMIAGAGGNIAVHVGDDGVLLVNSGSGKVTDKVLAAIRQLSDKPIRFILNTGGDPDDIGGNEAIAKAGSRSGGRGQGAGAAVIAHDGVLQSLIGSEGRTPSVPPGSFPTITFIGDLKDVYTNGEAVQLFHQRAAHAGGDSGAFFRTSDVVVTGEIVDMTRYPMIDAEQGGTLGGVLAA